MSNAIEIEYEELKHNLSVAELDFEKAKLLMAKAHNDLGRFTLNNEKFVAQAQDKDHE